MVKSAPSFNSSAIHFLRKRMFYSIENRYWSLNESQLRHSDSGIGPQSAPSRTSCTLESRTIKLTSLSATPIPLYDVFVKHEITYTLRFKYSMP